MIYNLNSPEVHSEVCHRSCPFISPIPIVAHSCTAILSVGKQNVHIVNVYMLKCLCYIVQYSFFLVHRVCVKEVGGRCEQLTHLPKNSPGLIKEICIKYDVTTSMRDG